MSKSNYWEENAGCLIWVIIIAVLVLWAFFDDIQLWLGIKSNEGATCVDVTSYDQNWNNDMKCTRPDGSVFYTSYSGAADYK